MISISPLVMLPIFIESLVLNRTKMVFSTDYWKKVTYLGLSNKISTRKYQHVCCPSGKYGKIGQATSEEGK